MASHLKIVFVICLLSFILMEEFKPALAKKGRRLKPRIKILETSMVELKAKIKALEECKVCSKIKELNDTIYELRGKGDSKTTSAAAGLEDSEILKTNASYLKVLGDFLKPVVQKNSQWKRCWRASVDGWASSTFHGLCDNKGPTVTIVRFGPYIFGGYTNISWTVDPPDCQYHYDPSAFMFSLVNKPGLQPLKLNQKDEASHRSIYSCSSYSPVFGGGNDFSLSNTAPAQASRGHTYDLPGYKFNSFEAQTFLVGSLHFHPDEVEVFYETT